MAERAVGTNDLIGATIVSVDPYAGTYSSLIRAEKNGVTYELKAHEEWDTCMCEQQCYCSASISYSAVAKIVE
jgi:hypothetical protein